MPRSFPLLALLAWLAWPLDAAAQSVDITVFLGGRAFPTFEDRLVLRAPAIPSLPDVEITSSGTPELRGDGGTVFGGALAIGAGIIGIEGRVDVTNVDFDVTGARYDLRATAPPFQGLTGSIGIDNGRLNVDRLKLISLNLRLRTPGPVGFILSGGLSYLPDITVTGSVPVGVEVEGVPIAGFAPRLRLEALPGESEHRFGVNAGAGLRLGGRVALVVEGRVFYFRSYDLRFRVDDSPPIVDQILASIDPIRFEPIIVNVAAGITIGF